MTRGLDGEKTLSSRVIYDGIIAGEIDTPILLLLRREIGAELPATRKK